MRTLFIITWFIILVGSFIAGMFLFDVFAPAEPAGPVVVNFEECIAAGNPVMESYPRQCRTAEGASFTEDIGNELEKDNLIRLESPRPGMEVASPLEVRGVARGYWYFEASFPVRILDEQGTEIGVAPAQAQGEWMTEEFVPFKVSVPFATSTTATGYLVLEKDNPSGDPARADFLKIPIRFKR